MKRKVAVGPGASSLILIAVVLSLSVLTVLTMISARNDEALAQRSVETRGDQRLSWLRGKDPGGPGRPAAKAQAEAPENYLAAVEAPGLPEGMRLEGIRLSLGGKAGKPGPGIAPRLAAPGETPRGHLTLHRLGEADIWDDSFEGFAAAEKRMGSSCRRRYTIIWSIPVLLSKAIYRPTKLDMNLK